MSEAIVYEVKSFSDPTKTYQVRELPDHSWRCQCPFFVFNEGKMRRANTTPACDHIRQLRHKKMKYHGRSK